jgi:hypothetical protein
MKISRYIKLPLVFGLVTMLYSLFFSFEPTLSKLLTAFSVGAILGIVLQIFNDYKIRKTATEATGQDFTSHQNRTISLLCNFEKAFDLCLEAVRQLKGNKIELADRENNFIKVKTGMRLSSFGNTVEFKIKTITENLTEIEISTNPVAPNTVVDYGESIKIIKTLTDFFDAENIELNHQQPESDSDIPNELYEGKK